MKKKLILIILFVVMGSLYLVLFQQPTSKSNHHATVHWNQDSVQIEGNGISKNDNTIAITSGGTYTFSGTCDDGNIVVNAKGMNVTLVFDQLHLTSKTTAPIYIKKANLVTIVLQENTENSIIDSFTYQYTDQEEINAAIHSKADFIIKGLGSLNINASYNNGITGKDTVTIIDSHIHIIANNNGIKAKDALNIEHADIEIESKGNGIKAYNETDHNFGTIKLSDSNINIHSEQDGIEAISSLVIEDGTYQITSGGGSTNASTKDTWGKWGNMNTSLETASAKGIKADGNITITSGTITIDSSDDAIHANGNITIQDGQFTIATGDDGIHADDTLTIFDGDLKITQSYEGIEATTIVLNGGNINITSSDDGINAAGGNDGSALNRPGSNSFQGDHSKIEIFGGYYVIHASGDGIDSNGDIEMNDGTLIIEGPTDDGNGAIDYNGNYNMNGGTLIAIGSSGMAEAPSMTSTQYSMKLSFDKQNSGSMIQIIDSNNQPVLTFCPSKNYSSLVYSSSLLKKGENYTIKLGGTTEKHQDGIVSTYDNANYENAQVLTTLTLSRIITTYKNQGMLDGRPNRKDPMYMPPRN